MTAPEKKPLRVIDWAAIRKAYEKGDDPPAVIAMQYGTSKRTIARRLSEENWLTRRNRARLACGLAAIPPKRKVDWAGIRLEYENGEFQVRDICDRHGIAVHSFYREARRHCWQARSPKAFGVGAKMKTTERLRDLVTGTLAGLEARHALGEKIDTDDALRGLHQLASLTVKILDIERKEKLRDDGERIGRLIINDASRLALAKRLDELARAWKHERDSRQTEARRIPAP